MATIHTTRPRRRTLHRPGGTRRAVLLGMEAFLSLNALLAGFALMTGGTNFDQSTIDHLPFHSQTLGGAALLVWVGVLPALAIALDLVGHRTAALAHLAIGPLTIAWIFVQVSFIGWSSVLQPVVLLYGIALTALAARTVTGEARRAG